MNLFTLLNRGAALAPKPKPPTAQVRAAEKARAEWCNGLLVDATRAWLDVGEAQPHVLNGLAILLSLAGFVHAHESGERTPEFDSIQKAMAAAKRCALSGDIVTADEAHAFGEAAQHAQAIIRAGSVEAIIHAAVAIRQTAGVV